MKHIQEASETRQGDTIPPVGAEELYRRSLRLRAERDIDRNMAAEKNK